MPTISFETTIAAPLEKVWAFHQDTRRALPALSPPGDDVSIEQADDAPMVGGKVIINARGPLGRIRWVARFVEIVPPHAVVFGQEARFVDEQESGPFKAWRHSHEFEAIDAKTTRLVDTINYTVGYGPLGWIADFVVVRPKLRAMFRHRHAATKRLLEAS